MIDLLGWIKGLFKRERRHHKGRKNHYLRMLYKRMGTLPKEFRREHWLSRKDKEEFDQRYS